MNISKDMQSKIDRLDEYDDAYYNGKPIVPDKKYDLFKDFVLRKLPPSHPRLDKVGHLPVSNWPKEQHNIHMGSQDKVSDVGQIRAWFKKKLADLGVKEGDIKFVVEYKIDGFSLGAEYETSLEKGITRGNGTIGENITENVRMFRHVPGILPIDKKVVVRGEGVLALEDYEAVQKLRKGEPYKNPRNAASGIARRYDGKFSKYVQYMTYDISANVSTEMEKMETLTKLGFKTVVVKQFEKIDDIIAYYEDVRDNVRDKLPFEIDGLVLKIDSIELQEKLGIKRNRPQGQVALKFDSDQATTTVKEIVLQVGRTGKITPVAILDPVDLMGSTVSRATLHNFDYISQSFIGVGAEVTIEKKGDIIPQVVDIVNAGEDYVRPELCPCCGGDLIFDGVNAWCRNPGCKEREVNRMTYWIKTIDIKGFSDKFVDKLWDMDKVRSVGDIYKLVPDDFTGVDGIGVKTVKSFFKSLESKKEMFLEKFITALGIKGCSNTTSTILVKEFKDWDTIINLKPEDIAVLPRFAETSSNTICAGLEEVLDMANDLLKVMTIKVRKEGPLTGKSVCVSGGLVSMGRKEFKDFIAENDGVLKSSVGAGLSYLVTNTPDSGSKKNADAKEAGTTVLTEEDFMKLVGSSVDEHKEPEEEKESEIVFVSENLFE